MRQDPDQEDEEQPLSSNSKGTLKTANRNPMSPTSTSKVTLNHPYESSEKDFSLDTMSEIHDSLKMEL
mgnify:CR=1 FL=1